MNALELYKENAVLDSNDQTELISMLLLPHNIRELRNFVCDTYSYLINKTSSIPSFQDILDDVLEHNESIIYQMALLDLEGCEDEYGSDDEIDAAIDCNCADWYEYLSYNYSYGEVESCVYKVLQDCQLCVSLDHENIDSLDILDDSCHDIFFCGQDDDERTTIYSCDSQNTLLSEFLYGGILSMAGTLTFGY